MNQTSNQTYREVLHNITYKYIITTVTYKYHININIHNYGTYNTYKVVFNLFSMWYWTAFQGLPDVWIGCNLPSQICCLVPHLNPTPHSIPYLGAGKYEDWASWSVKHVYWTCYGRSSSTEAVKKILQPLPLKRSKQKMPWLEWWDAKLTGRNLAHPPLGRANQQWFQNATPNCWSFQHAKAIAYLPIYDGGCFGEVSGHGHTEDVSSLNLRFLNVNKVENNTVRTRTTRLLKMIQTGNVPRTSICHLELQFEAWKQRKQPVM